MKSLFKKKYHNNKKILIRRVDFFINILMKQKEKDAEESENDCSSFLYLLWQNKTKNTHLQRNDDLMPIET